MMTTIEACPRCDQLRTAIRERHPAFMEVCSVAALEMMDAEDIDNAIDDCHQECHVRPPCWRCDQIAAVLRTDANFSAGEATAWLIDLHRRRHGDES